MITTSFNNNKARYTMRRIVKKYIAICFLVIIIVIFLNRTFNQTTILHNGDRRPQTNILWWTEILPTYNTIKTCGIYKCHFTVDRSIVNNSETKAIAFYGSNMKIDDFPLPRLNHHIWALFHEESPKNLPYIQYESILKHFNYTATFSRYSDFPLITQYIKDYETLRTRKYVIPIGEKTKLRKKLAPVVFLQSICDTMSGRNEYIQELMKFIEIDSYGKCLNNKNLPETLSNDYLQTIESDELYKFLAPYKFIISYENGVCNDYITEKFWRPLVIGSIPIYFGSPTIKDWLPNKKSAILITDYDSPKDLANFIKELDENDIEYNKYLDHKYSQITPISNSLLKKSLFNRDYTKDSIFEDFECFLCQKIHNINNNHPVYATQQHYDCGNKLLYPKMNKNIYLNDWNSILRNGKCQAQVLNRLLTNNRNYTTNDFEKQIINDINNGICQI